jgi:hypothetical protein
MNKAPFKCSTLGLAPGLTQKLLARDKHSSLLRKNVNYEQKKFNNIGPWPGRVLLPGPASVKLSLSHVQRQSASKSQSRPVNFGVITIEFLTKLFTLPSELKSRARLLGLSTAAGRTRQVRATRKVTRADFLSAKFELSLILFPFYRESQNSFFYSEPSVVDGIKLFSSSSLTTMPKISWSVCPF